MRNERLLYLIGPRGSGKSSVARLLAPRMGWDWVDADSLLESRARRTIRQIFADQGEPTFRRMESEILRELSTRENLVIATGGGIVLSPENRSILAQTGGCVWLTADATTLHTRISGDPGSTESRPNLSVGGLKEIEETLARRENLYRECAGLKLETGSRSTEELAEAILAWWTAS